MRAHLLCCRKRVRLVIGALWPLSALLAAPNLVYHEIQCARPGFAPCVMRFPSFEAFVLFKYAEFLLFYLLPLVIQCVLYTIVGLRLFSAESFRSMAPAVGREKYARSVKARRGVIKMLVAGVTVYFISFSPHQVLLLYNTLSSQRFEETWTYLIIVNMMAYTSSACNPLLYSVFSHKFRSKFLAILGGAQEASGPGIRHGVVQQEERRQALVLIAYHTRGASVASPARRRSRRCDVCENRSSIGRRGCNEAR
ncbi:hypothetical protein MTO96_014552 [Rhipicephalus appendiculatus]